MAQSTNHILMIKPPLFYTNDQTIGTNNFQKTLNTSRDDITAKMGTEFEALAALLRQNKINVSIKNGPAGSPDSIFPNNIFSTHENGTAVFYPMLAENRHAELTSELEGFFSSNYPKIFDYRGFRNDGFILEGTGSLVLDRVNKLAYMALSPRSMKHPAEQWCADMGYDLVCFEAFDENGLAVYHTNVVMFIGTKVAGVCFEAIREADREIIRKKLAASGHEIVELDFKQFNELCGNCLEVLNSDGDKLLVMSQRAFQAFHDQQRLVLERYYKKILHSDLATIETYGGGSARCMLAEIF